MTPEEKARAYDEAKARMSRAFNSNRCTIGFMNEIFPELAESEDERMRKEIIKFLRLPHRQFVGKRDHEKWIAWLEKQGVQKVSYTTLVETGNGGINALVTRELSTNSCDDANYCSGYINKKGCINCENEDMKETEHKVKSKFKVGDWIACKELNTALIVNVYDDKYEVEFIDGNKGFPDINYVDRFFHLWTIEDAKSGDVLIDVYGNIGIYEECDDFDWMSYCSLGFHGGSQNFKVEHENDKTHPATKEQRDTLMMAMANAGYTFDFNKKELRKIDTLLDLLQKMPSCITVDGIDYHFVMKKTIAFMAFYEGEGEGSGKVIFWMAGEPIELLTEMLEKLKKEGLLE